MTEKSTNLTVSVIGLGYIGLPAAAMFASRKVKVVGVDINKHAIDTINQGKIHIVEPELDMIVHAAVTGGYLKATDTPEPADAFLIAVPTPFKANYEPDVSYVMTAAKSIASVLKKGDVVILESTSPVGTTEEMVDILAQARPDLKFPSIGGLNDEVDVHIAYCPERVLPGHVVRELVQNDRIIGGLTAKCSERAIAIYRTFVEGELLVTDARTAEMSKLTENAFRDVNIAFANELSLICDKLEINVWELIKLANHHPRVNILQPGCGVGGHCIAVDPWFIVSKTPAEARIVRLAREVNDGKPEWVKQKVLDAVGVVETTKELASIRIACLGLAFKPDIDDLRESPALEITHALAQKYPGQVLAVEPNIHDIPKELNEVQVELVDVEQAIEIADILLVLVDHKEFKQMHPDLKENQVLVDTKGIW